MPAVTASRRLIWGKLSPFVQRTNEDVYRSVKKHAALILGDDWDVRLVEEEGTFTRPSAMVTPSAVASDQDGESQFFASMIQPFSIYAFPPVGETVSESRLIALDVEERLLSGFRFGFGEGRAMRVPLYSYRDIDTLTPATVRTYADFARISDLSVGSHQDPNDRTLWNVTCEIRLAWRRVPTVTSDPGNVVEAVTAQSGP